MGSTPPLDPSSLMSLIRLLLVDDNAAVRRGLRVGFAGVPDIQVSGEATSGLEARHLATSTLPDVILMDVRMQDGSGIDVVRVLHEEGVACPVVLMTAFDIQDYVVAGADAGARGFVLKTSPFNEFVSTIRAVAGGASRIAINTASQQRTEAAARRDLLTPREIAVVRALCTGNTSTAVVAAQLSIETETVKSYLKRIYETVGVSSRAELVAWAFRAGVVL